MVRREAGHRGATVIGYEGSISFDWYTENITVVMHHRSRTETINCTSKDGHGGGDTELVRDLLAVMRGKGKSRAPISAGIMSALMCLKARKSCETRKFQKIDVKELER
jgi:hypothetical protein